MFKKNKRITVIALSSLIGGMAGWVYWGTLGCNSDQCAIASNPYLTTAMGALLLAMVGDEFTHSKTNKQNKTN